MEKWRVSLIQLKMKPFLFQETSLPLALKSLPSVGYHQYLILSCCYNMVASCTVWEVISNS